MEFVRNTFVDAVCKVFAQKVAIPLNLVARIAEVESLALRIQRRLTATIMECVKYTPPPKEIAKRDKAPRRPFRDGKMPCKFRPTS